MFGEVIYEQGSYQELLLANERGVQLILCIEGTAVRLYRIEWEDRDARSHNSAQYDIVSAVKAFREAVELVTEPEPNTPERGPFTFQVKHICERCGVSALTKTVELANSERTAQLCQDCVTTVIRRNTAWKVREDEQEPADERPFDTFKQIEALEAEAYRARIDEQKPLVQYGTCSQCERGIIPLNQSGVCEACVLEAMIDE